MRVYGALMWSLGKVLNTPEVARVYIGYNFSRLHSLSKFGINNSLLIFCLFDRSFSDKPINKEALDAMGKELFEKEQDDLLLDLIDIPKKACDRRVCIP